MTDRYDYGSLETKFRLLNFHPSDVVGSITRHLLSGKGAIEVIGPQASGRSYLVEAAVFGASAAGKETLFVPVEQSGYEPGASLDSYLNFQLNRYRGHGASYMNAVHNEFKGVVDMPPLDLSSLLGVSLGVNLELPIKLLLRFLHGTSVKEVPGSTLTSHERLRAVLDQAMPPGKQVVLYFRDGLLLNDGMRRMLLDEAAVRSGLFVAAGYSATPAQTMEGIRIFVRPWTEEEMWARVTGRFFPNKFPNGFRRFAWNAAKGGIGPVSSRGGLGTVMLRLLKIGKLDQTPQGWTLPRHWERDGDIINEFCRDLYAPISEALGGLPAETRRSAELWLQMAAMCHPTIPVNLIAESAGIPRAERDAFIEDVLEDRFGADEQEAMFRDLEFRHPGFLKQEPLYEFLNPLMPEVIMRHVSDVELEGVAGRLLHSLDESRTRKSVAWVRLRLRIVSHLGLGAEEERMTHTLRWWVDQGEADSLRHSLVESMTRGEISPEAIWKAVKSKQLGWPSFRRYALVRAFGEQPGGVPEDRLVDYWLTWSGVSYLDKRFKEAIQVGQMALESGRLGDLEQARVRTVLGHSYFADHVYPLAERYFREALHFALEHFGAESPETLILMNDLALALGQQRNFMEARTMLQAVMDASLREVIAEEREGLRFCVACNLASILLRANEREQAEQVIQAHIRTKTEHTGPDFLTVLEILMWPAYFM